MHDRIYGRTGIRVSEIGLGGHQEGVETGQGLATNARFYRTDGERASVVARALDAGVTYFDTTYGCEIASLGRVLRPLGRRDACFVSAMRVDFFANLEREEVGSVRTYVRRELYARLRDFGFDTIDQFMLGAVDIGDPTTSTDVVADALDELERLRAEGTLRTIGISCHNPDYAARFLTAYPTLDAVMTPYNFANRVAEGALATALRQTGTAWIAMKPLVWHLYGLPVTALRHVKASPTGAPLDPALPLAQLALRFALQNPLLTTCVPAMADIAQVDENVAASNRKALNADEVAQLDAYARAMQASNGIPLAIGGLMVDNLRVRRYALALLERELGPELGLGPYHFDYTADDAELLVAQAAAAALDVLARQDTWRPLIIPIDRQCR